ncbi:MAG: hypothetical protein ACKODT_07165 [Fluviibacter sp.]
MPDRLVVLTLPLKAPLMTLNMQRRSHWSVVAKAKSETALLVGSAVKSARLKRFDCPISVRLVWFAPDARRRDVDGLAPMMKSILDALVELELIDDDSSRHVHDVQLGPIIISRDHPRFEIHIHRNEAG